MRLDERQPSPWDEPWRRLCAATLLQAVRDAAGTGYRMEPGDRQRALLWLRGEQAQRIASELGLDEALVRWLGKES